MGLFRKPDRICPECGGTFRREFHGGYCSSTCYVEAEVRAHAPRVTTLHAPNFLVSYSYPDDDPGVPELWQCDRCGVEHQLPSSCTRAEHGCADGVGGTMHITPPVSDEEFEAYRTKLIESQENAQEAL